MTKSLGFKSVSVLLLCWIAAQIQPDFVLLAMGASGKRGNMLRLRFAHQVKKR